MDNEQERALQALSSAIARSEEAQRKFAEGSSQHTLQKNRIAALRIAESLLAEDQEGANRVCGCSEDDLQRAVAPIASLLSKSEKAQGKLSPDGWQYKMLDELIAALSLVVPLLDEAVRNTRAQR